MRCSKATAPDIEKPDKNEYFYGPRESVIEGEIITRLYYGPPNFGENPETDEKEYPFILKLDKPIRVVSLKGDTENVTKEGITEIQVVVTNSKDLKLIEKSKNKHVRIRGTLFSAFSGHHHTDILIDVQSILDTGSN